MQQSSKCFIGAINCTNYWDKINLCLSHLSTNFDKMHRVRACDMARAKIAQMRTPAHTLAFDQFSSNECKMISLWLNESDWLTFSPITALMSFGGVSGRWQLCSYTLTIMASAARSSNSRPRQYLHKYIVTSYATPRTRDQPSQWYCVVFNPYLNSSIVNGGIDLKIRQGGIARTYTYVLRWHGSLAVSY